jgi:hypothetical protein
MAEKNGNEKANKKIIVESRYEQAIVRNLIMRSSRPKKLQTV